METVLLKVNIVLQLTYRSLDTLSKNTAVLYYCVKLIMEYMTVCYMAKVDYSLFQYG